MKGLKEKKENRVKREKAVETNHRKPIKG